MPQIKKRDYGIRHSIRYVNKNLIANIPINGIVSFYQVTIIYQQLINWPHFVLSCMSDAFLVYKKLFRALTDLHDKIYFIPALLANKFYSIKTLMFSIDNTGSLFHVTTDVCHFPPPFRRAFWRSAKCTTFIR